MDPSWCPNSKDWLNECLKFAYETYGIQDGHTLFIIDDCSADKSMKRKHQMFSELAFSGRHLNCSVWVIVQQYKSVLTDVRLQVKWVSLFYTQDEDTFRDTLRGHNVIENSEEKKIEEKLAKHKHSKLILITEPATTYWFEK